MTEPADHGTSVPTPDTIKFRLTGEREDIAGMIAALDPVLDIVQDWRIYPQRTGTRVSAYLEARRRLGLEQSRGDE
ncbi:hypothetical protein ACFVMC_26675 [Nocardia sp. NPDC127579]|uniref:hypothetical protein n=1 Tax=Nocardia sp. NPDC127579 TaxID=3345402 RepID=UPI003643A4EB